MDFLRNITKLLFCNIYVLNIIAHLQEELTNYKDIQDG